jgi:hypothetical protein
VTGTIGVTSDRHFIIAGYINTSHGKVSTSVSEDQKFSSAQTINFDTVNFTVLDQNTAMNSTVSSTTSVSSDWGTTVTRDYFSFPINVDLVYPVSTSPFGYNVTTAQKYQGNEQVSDQWGLAAFKSVTNSVKATDVSPAASSQKYTAFGSDGTFYNCQIASADNTLTKVSQGCIPHKNQ